MLWTGDGEGFKSGKGSEFRSSYHFVSPNPAKIREIRVIRVLFLRFGACHVSMVDFYFCRQASRSFTAPCGSTGVMAKTGAEAAT